MPRKQTIGIPKFRPRPGRGRGKAKGLVRRPIRGTRKIPKK